MRTIVYFDEAARAARMQRDEIRGCLPQRSPAFRSMRATRQKAPPLSGPLTAGERLFNADQVTVRQ